MNKSQQAASSATFVIMSQVLIDLLFQGIQIKQIKGFSIYSEQTNP